MPTLSDATLPQIRPPARVPAYDRRALTNGWVHIGVGGFHRAHQAVYLDDLLARGVQDWAICGVSLLPQDARMRDALVPQDGLYTVVERSAVGNQARVIGSLTRYLLAPDDPEAVLQALAAPQTRIVSLTITEGGYDVQKAAEQAGGAFGVLSAALGRRRRAGLPPFTVLSCDNVQHNGDAAHAALLAAASVRDPHLAGWIQAHVACPNSMVDRITPQTTEEDRAMVAQEFGIDDAWPVVCEPFRQWVIEDKFSAGRPVLEDVGAQFTSDVQPYETMKLRLLNASHSAMGYLGYLCGYRLIAEVMADPLFQRYIGALMDDEVTPLLAPVPGIDLSDYKRTLLARFANPTIKDQVLRICLDGSSKVPKFVLPSLREQWERGGPTRLLTLAVAGWLRFLAGMDEQGQPIPLEDPLAAELQGRALAGGRDPRPLLGLREVFGDLGDSPAFVAQLGEALNGLYAEGARARLLQAVGGEFARFPRAGKGLSPMKIYTKEGDAGETGLYGGQRVPKDIVRVQTLGTIDELNAALGVALTHCADEEARGVLTRIQGELFEVGADLATPIERGATVPRVRPEETARLESEIDRFEAELTPLRRFILPGGCPCGAVLHLARAVCRRAERLLVTLEFSEEINPEVGRYMNRLSDHLFVLARLVNHRAGVPETEWVRPALPEGESIV